ncbi:MAG: hypothetical protein KDD82_28640, partial [Planctomycetes bacterium]|nr:hypothetical protein [Planctomycetota bacterium]
AMKAEAEAARGKAEQARAETALARDALARKQELLDTLLRIERLPLDDAKVVEELEVFERGLAGAPGEELLRRQLARLYLLHGDWQHAAETALDAALTVSLAEPPPFTDVFTAYALRTTRVGLDEFNRHLEGRGPYFGDLRPSTLEALAARGWPEESGFPAFARALRAVCSEGDQDLTVAEAELGDAVARADHPSTPLGTQAALRIFQGHLAFHRGEARARQGLDPAEEFARAVAFADAALETGAHASFAHLLRALALRATIRDGDPASASPALDACEAALAADPTLGLAYAVRQGIHQRVRAPALVLEADASAALRFRPGDGQLHHWRGQVRLQLGQEGAQPWGAAGWGRRAQADFEAAVATWDRVAGAHGFNVGQVNSRVGLSSALLLQGDLRAALETLERCEALSAGAGSTPAEQNAQRSALTQHVALLLQSQRLDAARPRLERLLARWPDDPNGVYFRGLERLLQGDRPGAEAALARLLELAPESVMARDLREKLAAR